MKIGLSIITIVVVSLLVLSSASALHTIRPRPDFDFGDSQVSQEPQVCGVSIEKFDYLNTVQKGQESIVLVSAVNTGNKGEFIRFSLFAGNTNVGSFSKSASPGQRIANEFIYRPAGSHELRLNVLTDCGVSKTMKAGVNVVEIMLPEQRPALVLEKEIPETFIEINPVNLDVSLGKSGIIEISIETGAREKFEIQASGVPEDWLDYQKETDVLGSQKIVIFITPKELGKHTINIAINSDRGTQFEADVNLFVAVPSGAVEKLDLFGTISAMIDRTIETIKTNPRFFGTLVVSFLLFTLAVGVLRLKKEDYY